MLLVDLERLWRVQKMVHTKYKAWRSPTASPVGECDLTEVLAGVDGGVNAVQLRETQVADLTRPFFATQILLHDAVAAPLIFLKTPLAPSSAALAPSLDCGVHLPGRPIAGFSQPQNMATVRAASGGESILVSRSVHSVDAAVDAEREGADLIVAGTVFPSMSHPGGDTLGLPALRSVCESVSVPVIGIGGITAKNAGNVIRAGASGVAVISAIWDAPDPRVAAAELRSAIDAAWKESHSRAEPAPL
jgi:thiamine monophosphate synthase